MGGKSPQEKQAETLYNDIGKMNTSSNELSNFSYPYSGESQINTVNQQTALGKSLISKTGANNVAGARRAAGKSALSRGYGGTVASDMVAGAGNDASANTTTALQRLMSDRLSTLPGIMKGANQDQFALAGAKSNESQNNIRNMFSQAGLKQGALGAFSSDNWLDDVLGVANTAAKFIPGVPK